MRPIGAILCAILTAMSGMAAAEVAETVPSLLKQEFAVVGTFLSQAGAGLFLQKKDRLFFCVVAETPQSKTVTTRYCKPVE
jgi:hypothetical protein